MSSGTKDLDDDNDVKFDDIDSSNEGLEERIPDKESDGEAEAATTEQADHVSPNISIKTSEPKAAQPASSGQTQQQQQKPAEPASDSRFFAIRTTGGQERVVSNTLQTRISSKKIGVRSILVLDSFKGYIIVEAPDSNVAYEALAGIRHVRGQIRGDLPFKDIEGYLIKKPTVTELNVEDVVEVIAGPFKSMKAKIVRVDYEKQEATVVLLDSPYQIPVTVDANYLKKAPH